MPPDVRRVLMVSPHFPPDTSAGAHRVRLVAPYLAAFGWEPIVVTVDPAGYEGRLDPDLAQLVPASLRVRRASAWPASLTRRIGLGDLGLRAWAGVRRVCTDLMSRERIDALFITVYPTYPALLGPGLKRRYRVPFVLDYQDPWVGAWGRDVGGGPGGTPDVKSRLTRRLGEWLEPIALRAADGVTAVSERTFDEALARVPAARPRVRAAIPLGADPQDVAWIRRHPRPNRWFDPHDGAVHVCYVGTLLPKGLDIARALLAGLAHLRRTQPEIGQRIRLHFIGTSNTRDPHAAPRVLPLAAEAGVADSVTEVPMRLDYLDALTVQVDADLLLLMGSSEPHYTPSKVFPALLTGRPLLAISHPESPVLALLATQPQATIVSLGPEEVPTAAPRLAAALACLVRAPARLPARSIDEIDAEPWSARSCARAFAQVFDAVAS